MNGVNVHQSKSAVLKAYIIYTR